MKDHELTRRLVTGVACSAFATLFLASVAVAQPEEGEPETPSAEGLGDPATEPGGEEAGASGTDERLRRLEERDSARQQQLDEANARIAELEAANQPTEETEAEAETDTGPTIRPLASMMTRLEVREGYEDLNAGNPGCFPGPNDGDCLRYRARVGMEIGNLRVSDDVVAGVRFQPQVTGFWSLGGSGGVTHPQVALYEGNLVLRIADSVRLEAGRIVLNYGDQMIIGQLGWHPAARSFDGTRLRYQPEENGYYIDAFWTMLAEGGPGDFGYGDTYFYGVYAGLGPLLGEGIALDAYALGLQVNDGIDPVGGTPNDWTLLVHLGGRFRYRISLVDLRAEAGLQVGRVGLPVGIEPVALIAGHIDAEVGINLLDDRFRVGLEGLFASGDNPTTQEFEGYSQLFPTAHAFLGFTDVMGGRTNVSGGALHLMGKPLPQLRLGLDVHVFVRPEVLVGDNYAGTEGDLSVAWTPGAGLRVRGMYGIYLPNQGFFAVSDPVHYFEAELLYQIN